MIYSPCYIAAPYEAPDPMGVAWHTLRAGLIARIAALDGLAPILLHPAIPLIYGEEDEAGREARRSRTDAIVEMVARTTMGRMYLLELDPPQAPDGTITLQGKFSPGVRDDYMAWTRVRGRSGDIARGTWLGWEPRARRHGLGAAWSALAQRPRSTGPGEGGPPQSLAALLEDLTHNPEALEGYAAELQISADVKARS